MKLVKPSFEIWNQPAGLEGIYKQIEKVGRVCYKSEDKITEDSAKPFVDRMIKSGHGAMLEHGTVYLKVPTKYVSCNPAYEETVKVLSWGIKKYLDNQFCYVNLYADYTYITTNLRVLVENNWLDDLKYLCEPTEYHEKRITVHFVCDRGVSHEFVRHRVMSFAQESTRYCNYSKDKFGNELAYIIPNWLNLREGSYTYNYPDGFTYNGFNFKGDSSFNAFLIAIARSEKTYMDLIELGWKPQEARAVLPNSLKTELVVTGFISDWNHFFDLRARGTTGAPHPQAKELAEPLMKEFIARKYINN